MKTLFYFRHFKTHLPITLFSKNRVLHASNPTPSSRKSIPVSRASVMNPRVQLLSWNTLPVGETGVVLEYIHVLFRRGGIYRIFLRKIQRDKSFFMHCHVFPQTFTNHLQLFFHPITFFVFLLHTFVISLHLLLNNYYYN